MKKIFLSITILIIFATTGCQKIQMEQNTNQLIPQNTKKLSQTDIVSQNEKQREQLAISLAKAMENRWDFIDLETCGFGITEIDDGSNFNFEFGFTYIVSPHISFPFKLVYTGKAHDDNLGQDQLYTDNIYRTLDCGDLFEMKCKY